MCKILMGESIFEPALKLFNLIFNFFNNLSIKRFLRVLFYPSFFMSGPYDRFDNLESLNFDGSCTNRSTM